MKSKFLRLCAVLGFFALFAIGLASAQNYDAVQKRLMEAVKNGEISPEQAKIMMAASQKGATGEKAHTRKPAPIKKPEVAKKSSVLTKNTMKGPGPDLGAAWAKLITSLVDEGKISKEDAIAKMAALKKQAALSKSPAGKKEAPSKVGPKKKSEGDHEAGARKLKAAVAAGKLTPEQAKAKWEALQKQSAGKKKAKVKK